MSHNSIPTSSFGSIQADNAFIATTVTNSTITIRDHHQPRPLDFCRSIPFAPNEDLVHRAELTSWLGQLAPASPGHHAAVLWGLGGSGKTQIALAYAYSRCSDPNCSVLWVRANSETAFVQDYQSIARKIGLASYLKGEQLLHAVREWIEKNPNWVLVLDKADDPALFRSSQERQLESGEPKLNLNDFVPRCMTGTGTVLWTSCDRRIASLVSPRQAMSVVQMAPGEARILLSRVRDEETKEEEYDAEAELLTELNYFPLAVSQAAAHMQRTSTSIGDYLSELRRRDGRWKILRASEHDRYRPEQVSNSILETLDASIEKLREDNELAYEVLHTLAFVNNFNISFELIREATWLNKARTGPTNRLSNIEGDSNEDPSNNYDDNRDTIDVITRLCELSFISIRASSLKSPTKSYDMHKLVHETAQHRLQKGEVGTKGSAWFAKAAFEITNKFVSKTPWKHWEKTEQFIAPTPSGRDLGRAPFDRAGSGRSSRATTPSRQGDRNGGMF
ncbi:hypothetical protein GGS21DRAFT_322124 [Xylaria nigripes]|nr:hypothetical protein GGS21DRAFT_322124 [Xylaria nigripes]